MQWRMTYNNVDGTACSARGIAHRETKEELEVLAEELAGRIINVKIEENRTFSREYAFQQKSSASDNGEKPVHKQ